MKKFFSILFIVFLFSDLIFSLDTAGQNAALRYAQIANSFLLDKNYSDALKNTDYGLNYNSDLSDLYYIKAKSLYELKQEKFKVLENIEKAWNLNNYREVSPALAKTFYAQLLCDTRRPEEAISLIESQPLVFNSDTEYIRALALYRMQRKTEARKVIDSARKIFTENPLFPELFFTWENPSSTDKKLLSAFINNINTYAKKNPEILLLASKFVSDKDNDFLQQYNEVSSINLDFISECLKKNIIFSEEEALVLTKKITQNSFPLKFILEFKKLFKQSAKDFTDYINSYSGIILQDYYFDRIDDTFIYVKDGSVYKIQTFDFQDDKVTVEINIKDDKIQRLLFPKVNLQIEYSDYPYVSNMLFSSGENIFTVPYEVSVKFLSLKKEFNFSYINKLDYPVSDFSLNQNFNFNNYLQKISSFKTQTQDNTIIEFHLLDGIIISADYFTNDSKTAYAAFEKGIPLFRKSDKDFDGSFETTEIFGNDEKKAKVFQSENEKNNLEKSLFGTLKMKEGIYLSKVTADLNNDFINDYSEIFDDDEFFIKEWDSDFDGVYDTSYKQNKHNLSQEFICYTQPLSKKKITTELKDGIPLSIDDSISVKNVTKGQSKFFYWIGIRVVNEAEDKIIGLLENDSTCFIDFEGKRITASKIGNFYFGEVIDEN